MAKSTKSPKGPINFDRLTDGQQSQIHRIAQTGARIGIAQQREHRAILDAMRDEIDAMLEASTPAFIQSFFEAYLQSAKLSNLKRMAKHPLCPVTITDEIALRVEEGRKPAIDDVPPATLSAKAGGAPSKA